MRDFSERYLKILTGQLAGLNLTRITTSEDFYNKQIIDSILPFQSSKIFQNSLEKNKVLIDIGFGGGFPLIPLAFINPKYKFIGFEARGKKAEAVKLISTELGLKNVFPKHQRYEEIFFDKNVTVTFKAVGTIEEMLSKFSVVGKIQVFFYKGPNLFELEDLKKVLLKWEIIEDIDLEIPGTEGRKLIGFENKSVIVPRGTNKTLVKLSELI